MTDDPQNVTPPPDVPSPKSNKSALDDDTAARLGLGKGGTPKLDHIELADAQLVAKAIGGTIENRGVAFHVEPKS